MCFSAVSQHVRSLKSTYEIFSQHRTSKKSNNNRYIIVAKLFILDVSGGPGCTSEYIFVYIVNRGIQEHTELHIETCQTSMMEFIC